MQGLEPIIFQLIVLVMSVVIHEVAHGAAAYALGDPTAKLAGRLTLNPMEHLDFFGSFLLPVMLFFISGGGFMFGYAKPVPYNPYNLKYPRWGPALVAVAGPLANLALAAAFALVYRFVAGDTQLASLVVTIVAINVILAVFNIFPIPPLDGSKVLMSALPSRWDWLSRYLERYGMIILIIFLVYGGPIINAITVRVIAGLLRI